MPRFAAAASVAYPAWMDFLLPSAPRRFRTLLSVVMLVAGVGFGAGSAGADVLSDASADKVVASVVVPDSSRKVGEVRLIARGQAVVVQTLVSTKLLSRVIAEIGKKEEKNWPAGQADTVKYLAALESARETVEKRSPAAAWDDRRRRLLIEFAADAGSEAVFIGTFRYSKDGSDRTPYDREIFSTLALSRAYVLRNIRLILADSFKTDEKDVDRLGPLGPAAASSAAAGEPAPAKAAH